MSKTDDEIFMENCGPEKLRLLAFVSFLILTPLTLLFSIATYSYSRRCKVYHPVFSALFFLLLLAYTLASLFLAIRNFLFAFTENADFMSFKTVEEQNKITRLTITCMERVYIILNFYTQPLIAIGLLERLFATIRSSKYENSRKWHLLSIFLVISGVIVFFEYDNRHKIAASISTRNIQTFLSIFITLCLILLLFANREKTKKKSRSFNSDLTERYQLVENVKVLRMFIPIVIIDCSIQILFLLTDFFLNVWQVLNLNYCYDDNLYLQKFLVFRVIGFLMQYGIPLLVFHNFGVVKLFPSKKTKKMSMAITPISEFSKAVTVRNVLGVTVSGKDSGKEGQEAHFKSLSDHWK